MLSSARAAMAKPGIAIHADSLQADAQVLKRRRIGSAASQAILDWPSVPHDCGLRRPVAGFVQHLLS